MGGIMLRSSIGSRRGIEPSVPMTAVRGAGYSSAAGRGAENTSYAKISFYTIKILSRILI